MPKPISSLLGPDIEATGDPSALVTGLTADSRALTPGTLFAAVPGFKAHGNGFISDALAKGAGALLVGRDVALPDGVTVPVLRAADARIALAHVAARYYGPGPRTIVAVTGTSGKTSVAEFTRQIFARAGHKAASVGTLGVVKPDGAGYGSLTTPDPITLARTLAQLAGEGVTHLAMEASSHGLDQNRLDAVPLAAGAFTNLGRDHMDYHPTVEHYLAAKLRLFRELLRGAPAVVNTDGAYAGVVLEAIAATPARAVLTVGTTGQTVRLAGVERAGFHQRLTLVADGETHTVELPLVGAYQVENALTAAGLAVASGAVTMAQALAAIGSLKGVPGRLEIVGTANGALGVVDYAHKPEALMAVLDALRPFASGRLICVFGCGGDRDQGKRPIMGQIAAANADLVIVTDDNPRSEDPAAIRAQILAAAPAARDIGDRAEAIRAAVGTAQPGDVVLIAGKGHETGQIVGASVLPFSDHEVLRAAMAERSA